MSERDRAQLSPMEAEQRLPIYSLGRLFWGALSAPLIITGFARLVWWADWPAVFLGAMGLLALMFAHYCHRRHSQLRRWAFRK